jgi:hypothetical protein
VPTYSSQEQSDGPSDDDADDTMLVTLKYDVPNAEAIRAKCPETTEQNPSPKPVEDAVAGEEDPGALASTNMQAGVQDASL